MQPATASPPPATPTPRKSRKLWYILGGFALLLVATPVCFYFVSGWWTNRQLEEIYAEIDAEDPNWRWPDLLAEMKPPPDDENAAVQIAKVCALLQKTPYDPGPKWHNAAKQPGDFRNARLTREQADLLRAAFGKLDPALLPEARKMRDLPRGVFVIEDADKPFFQINLGFAQQTRGVLELLQHDALLRAHENDRAGAVESCQALLHTAGSLREQPFLISQLVRYAGDAIAVATIERTLAQEGEVADADLHQLQIALERESADDGLHAAMRGERAGGHQLYEQLRAGKISFSEIMGSGNRKIGVEDRLLDAFPGIILNGYPEYLKTMSEQVRAAKLKDAERADAMHKIEEKAKQRPNMLTRMILPATSKVNEASQRRQATLRCAAVGVAAERYRLKHHHWPGKLDDLVQAGLLKEVPTDPYDGQPLRLTRTPTGLIIYSIGPDLVDNGGKLDRNSPRAPNTDLGFELWDDAPERRFRGVAPPVEEK